MGIYMDLDGTTKSQFKIGNQIAATQQYVQTQVAAAVADLATEQFVTDAIAEAGSGGPDSLSLASKAFNLEDGETNREEVFEAEEAIDTKEITVELGALNVEGQSLTLSLKKYFEGAATQTYPSIVINAANSGDVVKQTLRETFEAGESLVIYHNRAGIVIPTVVDVSYRKMIVVPVAPITQIITINAIAADDIVNAVENNVPFFISGTITNHLLEVGVTDQLVIECDNVVEGNAVIDGAGNWTMAFDNTFTDGLHTMKASTAYGSVERNFSTDASIPASPIINSYDQGQNKFYGSAEAGALVKIYEEVNGDLLGQATADGLGNFEITRSFSLGDGNYNAYATATDNAGNISASSSMFPFSIDNSVPLAPVITFVDPDTGEVSGTAEPFSVVDIYDFGVQFGSDRPADASGNWTGTFAPFAEGDHSFTADASDAAGNRSVQSSPYLFTVDNSAPPAPSIIEYNTGLKRLFGSGEAGSTISIYDGVTLLGTTIADGLGNWAYTPDPELADGTHNITATATDAANNTSAPSDVLVVEIASYAVDITSAPSTAFGGSPYSLAGTVSPSDEPVTIKVYEDPARTTQAYSSLADSVVGTDWTHDIPAATINSFLGVYPEGTTLYLEAIVNGTVKDQSHSFQIFA